MKKLILALVVLSSITSFAAPSDSKERFECIANLSKKYPAKKGILKYKSSDKANPQTYSFDGDCISYTDKLRENEMPQLWCLERYRKTGKAEAQGVGLQDSINGQLFLVDHYLSQVFSDRVKGKMTEKDARELDTLLIPCENITSKLDLIDADLHKKLNPADIARAQRKLIRNQFPNAFKGKAANIT